MKDEILKKFKHIGVLTAENVNYETEKIDKIEDRLDYLKSLYDKYYCKYQLALSKLSVDQLSYIADNKDFILKSIYRDSELETEYKIPKPFYYRSNGEVELVTPLQIQKSVYDRCFKNADSNPAYTYWFLKFNAGLLFETRKFDINYRNAIKSKNKDAEIKAIIGRIKKEAEASDDFLNSHGFDISKQYDTDGFLYTYKGKAQLYSENRLLALIRVLNGQYYKDNIISDINNVGSFEAQAYCDHILYLPHLESLLKNVNAGDYLVFKNNFNDVDPIDVYNYFHSSLVEKKHLDIKTLNKYLVLAFQDLAKPDEKFTLKNVKTKQKIIDVFYEFYNGISLKPHGKKSNYVSLMSDYFIGYKHQNVYSNFSR